LEISGKAVKPVSMEYLSSKNFQSLKEIRIELTVAYFGLAFSFEGDHKEEVNFCEYFFQFLVVAPCLNKITFSGKSFSSPTSRIMFFFRSF
jgi:hypothetical protein